jgi:uncharacterized protein (DUF1015 family)
MPQIEPLRALQFASTLRPELGRLIAPPYDVISAAQRTAFARHPHNIVHVDLPVAGAGGDPYSEAARLLSSWRDEGILQRDQRPTFPALEQTYRTPSGGHRTRRGLFARLRLEPLDSGVVIPHERTLEKPRADRERLLAATRTQLSPIFMLHPDPGAEIATLLAQLFAAAPTVSTRDSEGQDMRLAAVEDEGTISRLQRLLAPQWALIADGHHRYESALQYRGERREAGVADAEHALVFLCSLEDPGLSIFPIHRLVKALPDFRFDAVLQAVRPYFEVEAIDGGPGLVTGVRSAAGRPGVFGLVGDAGRRGFLLRWREGAGLDRPGMRSIPAALQRLDVILLHRLLFEEVLGIDAEAQARGTHLEYVKDETELLERAAAAQLGVLLNPTRIEQVIEISRTGMRLPQKSTYFYPKVPTGLVLDPLDG